MMQRIIDGVYIARSIQEQLNQEIVSTMQTYKLSPPKLVYIQIGNHQESIAYRQNKQKIAQKLGIDFYIQQYDEKTTQSDLQNILTVLNNDKSVNGIFLPLPLPQHIDQSITLYINPQKDIDCLHPLNSGMLRMKGFDPNFIPGPPLACIKILQYIFQNQISTTELYPPIPQIKGKIAVIVGRSNIVGSPLVGVMTHYDATVIICNSHTVDLQKFTLQADILLTATGQPGLIKRDMIKQNAIVIDIGTKMIQCEDLLENQKKS